MQELLPDETPYKVTEFKLLDSSVSQFEKHFLAEIRLAIKDVTGAKDWLKRFQEENQVTLRVRASATTTKSGQNAYKTYFRCQHNTRSTSTADQRRGCKNTHCPALMTVTVEKPGLSRRYVSLSKKLALGMKWNKRVRTAKE